jgi:hypothetical protein
MKIVKILLFILYVTFASLQWNDPDPLLWIGIYGMTAMMILLNLLGWHSRVILGVLIIVGVIYSLTYLGGVIDFFEANDPGAIAESMHFDRPYIEETREFGGLWIALAGLLFIFYKK